MAESFLQSKTKARAPLEKRPFAVLAYILPLIGGLLGLALDRGNALARTHAQQSIAAVLTLALGFVVWAVAGYVIALIPIAGPIVSLALFSLVVALAIFLIANWILSLIMALRGQARTMPLSNRLARRIFGETDS